jgi:hypothetical protein
LKLRTKWLCKISKTFGLGNLKLEHENHKPVFFKGHNSRAIIRISIKFKLNQVWFWTSTIFSVLEWFTKRNTNFSSFHSILKVPVNQRVEFWNKVFDHNKPVKFENSYSFYIEWKLEKLVFLLVNHSRTEKIVDVQNQT